MQPFAPCRPSRRCAPRLHSGVAPSAIVLRRDRTPKPLTDEVVRAADVVITMGCGDACPVYPGKRYEDWQLEDPSGKDLAAVRRIRDDIDARVSALIGRLTPAA
jgi:arsenate reductase